ncbi:hypothetical protein FM104_01190 [Microbacterium esteraromaticum]|uniref:Glycoside-hydrolase family GH114 TIM-barrel domain-containing protein n=1 Tax=Microbacterium esteraromaticum TaxID=57043 RepID=A0A1R4ICM2_9MICO|nr:endo alpha-1,4 polygalactosaminidase [Microbacterium esteraromaticum]SJN17023.1 hypothetical protein FM104_01190 [Microbacterium esteraromaticum]
MRRAPALTASALLLFVLAGCGAAAPSETEMAIRLPDAGADFDYQLGGAYPPPDGATVIVRDRLQEPAGLGYDICYINGFQTQPDASEKFAREHPELVLHVGDAPLADPGWPDEFILDTSTEEKRAGLAEIVRGWIEGCRDAGYAAVEIDNLDSFSRSRGALAPSDNLALAAEYARIAHAAGLAIAQKNTAELTTEIAKIGYDFAVTESCAVFDECTSYAAVYDVVLDIEYADGMGSDKFAAACAARPAGVTMILRDHDLRMPGHDDYVRLACSPVE